MAGKLRDDAKFRLVQMRHRLSALFAALAVIGRPKRSLATDSRLVMPRSASVL